MGINKDLNVDPYYDDFDEDKQFNRVLFKPSRAVQARELTQLQTILQKQVERFGSNVYKEGTIISGINLTSRSDLNFVKLEDQVGFDDPSLFNEITDAEGATKRYKLVGKSNGLEAEIIAGLNGFETSAPNLKTFFINYLKSDFIGDTTSEVKTFARGESLEIRDWNDNPVTIGGTATSVTTIGGGTQGSDHVGKSFGISCEEGVIYQKGHFIFVDKQFIIVTRYSNTPGQSPTDPTVITPVSVGFTIEENLVDSNQDSSLLDNAAGFNNYNAPGADRLQLVPKLVSYETASEPEEFFALIRYTDGNATRIRDFTEFSTLGDELARRTYEESGNYVVNGLDAYLDKVDTDEDGIDDEVQVKIEPGKEYVYGRELTNVSNVILPVDPIAETQTKNNQKTGVNYDQYFEVNMEDDGTSTTIPWEIGISQGINAGNYHRYNLLGGVGGTVHIGTCNVLNIEPPSQGSTLDGSAGAEKAKVYVFNLAKFAGQENTAPTFIAKHSNTFDQDLQGGSVVKTAVSELFNSDQACMIFDSGKDGLTSVSDINLTRRKSRRIQLGTEDALTSSQKSAYLPAESSGQPVVSDNAFAITTGATPTIHRVTAIELTNRVNGQGYFDALVTFGTVPDGATVDIFYDMGVVDSGHDTLTEKTGFIKPQFNSTTNRVQLGVPNVVEVISVSMVDGQGDLTDVTSRFRLVNNQKDGVYGLSYLRLITGQKQPENSTLLVKMKYLERSNTGGFLTQNSYPASIRNRIGKHTAKNLYTYDLLTSFDLRPYTAPAIDPKTTSSSALSYTPTVNNLVEQASNVTGVTAFANNSVINSTQQYKLSRIDTVVLDEYGNTLIVKGGESENPSPPRLINQYGLANVIIPGGAYEITGENRIEIQETSNKNYTMRDIEELEGKLDRLTDMVTMSMAEQETSNLIIRGADGVDRFKNGILADTFNDLTGAEFVDPEFNAAVDKSKGVAMPAIKEFPVDLKIDPDSMNGVSDTFEDLTSLSIKTEKSVVVAQPYATGVRNCVSNYYDFQGKAHIYPKYTYHRDVLLNPKMKITTEITSQVLELVKRVQKFVPVNVGKNNSALHSAYVNALTKQRGTYKVGYRSPFVKQAAVQILNAANNGEKYDTAKDLGGFLQDNTVRPYVRRHLIRISATGLRPNTKHYFFFGGKNVDPHVRQFRYSWLRYYRRYRRRGRGRVGYRYAWHPRYLPWRNWADYYYGRRRGRRTYYYSYSSQNVFSDSRGSLFAYFYVPAGQFLVGQNKLEMSDVSDYSRIGKDGTSYASQTQRAYCKLTNSEISSTTRGVDVDSDTSVVKREFQVKRRDPIAQTFKLRASGTGNANFGYLSDISVYFKQKSATQGITLEVREVEEGVPTQKVLPGATAYLESDDINVHIFGQTASTFEFEHPIKLKADFDYCFVLLPDGGSPEYLVFTAKAGKFSVSKGGTFIQERVTNDWGDGVLYAPTNDSTWKPYSDEDMKFTINRYNFNQTGTIDLIPNDVEFLTIRDNKKDPANQAGTSAFLEFEEDETVYVETSASFSGSIGNRSDDDQESPEKLVVNLSSLGSIAVDVGDYLIVKEVLADADTTPDKIVGQVEAIDDETISQDQFKVFTLDTPWYELDPGESSEVSVTLAVTGKVSYYDPENPEEIHLDESSARYGNYFDNSSDQTFGEFQIGQLYTIRSLGTIDGGVENGVVQSWKDVSGDSSFVPAVCKTFIAAVADSTTNSSADGTARPNNQRLIGLASGAEATITRCNSQGISYFQPRVLVDNTPKTSHKVELFKLSGDQNAPYNLDKPIAESSDVYVSNNPRVIVSKSKQIDNLPAPQGNQDTPTISEDFRLRVTLNNNEFDAVTPTLDDDLSNLSVYEYQINDSKNAPASSYISKEVILNPDIPAEGLKVIIDAYRPPGTHIDVYARFINANNSDEKTDWEELVNKDRQVYSALNNQEDYREFEYNYTEPDTETLYTSFQIKLSFRHSTSAELTDPAFSGVVVSKSIFPHIRDYRAVALT